ncbi:hypothetical protein BGZ65_000199 [Modicella reniformis]|uniref:Cytochrome c oxidase assembly factor 3 n=1 Tax=Modicella reniformis TaxID=1440133 RepID=A0A9P6IM04_9FUNG|nr:hypothetical protein BGZ65_000199 [Modicella reniformis]
MAIFPKPTSYYEQGFRRSPALERATAPFRIRNTITGAGIVVFCLSVYAYSIMAVRQDDFSDIELPAHVIAQQKEAAAAKAAATAAKTGSSRSSPS